MNTVFLVEYNWNFQQVTKFTVLDPLYFFLFFPLAHAFMSLTLVVYYSFIILAIYLVEIYLYV